MKRAILILLVLAFSASGALAQPDSSYVGVFSDVNHSIWRVDYTAVPPAPTLFYAYIWWLPSVRGITGAEFALTYPTSMSDMIIALTTLNPTDLFVMGTLASGITIAWNGNCMTDWTYSHRLTCYLFSVNPNQIMIVEHPTVVPSEYHVSTCELGTPIEPVKRYTHLYLNWDGGIAVENTSWGAIKSLF